MSEPLGSQPIKKQSFLQGTAILALGTILVKLMGFLFKTPLNNIIGEDGFGYFNTAYDVYNVLLMISTTGLPVAMSRMISQAQTLGDALKKKSAPVQDVQPAAQAQSSEESNGAEAGRFGSIV